MKHTQSTPIENFYVYRDGIYDSRATQAFYLRKRLDLIRSRVVAKLCAVDNYFVNH